MEDKKCCWCGSKEVKPHIVIPIDSNGGNLVVEGGVLSIQGHVCQCGYASYYDAFGTLQSATWTGEVS